MWYSWLTFRLQPKEGEYMAKTKKSIKRVARRHKMIDTKIEDLLTTPVPAVPAQRGMWSPRVKKLVLLLLVLLVGFFLVKRGYVVAAMVNSQPIFRWDLNSQLATRFGQQTLESMITEKLIADAAVKKGIVVGQADVDAKVASITATLGPNVNLEQLLQYQGMTRADFEHQIRLQLMVEKVLGKDVTVEESEITTFVQNNRETMTATDEASIREEARANLVSQKTSEKMQPWLMELRDKATIVKFF